MKNKILYIVLTIVFLFFLSIAIYLFVQIQGSNQSLFKVTKAVPTSIPEPTVVPTQKDEYSSIEDNFLVAYRNTLKVKKEVITGGTRYTFSGGPGFLILNVGNKYFVDSPTKGVNDGKGDIGGIKGYVYGETDKFYNINFKNGDKFYTFECIFNKSAVAITDCIVFNNTFKFLK